jgi:hypothetical protein
VANSDTSIEDDLASIIPGGRVNFIFKLCDSVDVGAVAIGGGESVKQRWCIFVPKSNEEIGQS